MAIKKVVLDALLAGATARMSSARMGYSTRSKKALAEKGARCRDQNYWRDLDATIGAVLLLLVLIAMRRMTRCVCLSPC
jgi:hypothetical protein